MQPQASDLLTSADVAARLRVSRQLVCAYAAAGVLACGTYGGGRRFRAADVDALDERARTTGLPTFRQCLAMVRAQRATAGAADAGPRKRGRPRKYTLLRGSG